MTGTARSAPRLFGRRSWAEARRIADILRKETIGGALLLAGAALAMVLANSPWSAAYEEVRSFTIGPAWLHLNLSMATWAADGLLAIFFFVAGLELKREFVAGDLRQPRRAAVPVAAALGGVIVPAALYLLLTRDVDGAAAGWAIHGWHGPLCRASSEAGGRRSSGPPGKWCSRPRTGRLWRWWRDTRRPSA